MKNTDQPTKNTEEVDLTQFLRWIGNGFNRIGNNILYVIASFRNTFFNNKLFFAVILIAGVSIGVTYYLVLQKKAYKSSMVLNCSYLSPQVVQANIEKLKALASNDMLLSRELNIDLAVAENIQSFEYKSFVSEEDVIEAEIFKEQLNNVAPEKKELAEKLIRKLQVEGRGSYQISVLVYNPSIVKTLDSALVLYFRNSEYLKSRIEANRQILIGRRNKLIQESKKLDSLKSLLFQNYSEFGRSGREGSNNVILRSDNLANPLDVFKEDIQITNQLLEIDRILKIQPDFEVVSRLTTFSKPETATLLDIVGIAILISFISGYLIIGIWRFDRMLANYPTNR